MARPCSNINIVLYLYVRLFFIVQCSTLLLLVMATKCRIVVDGYVSLNEIVTYCGCVANPLIGDHPKLNSLHVPATI